MLRGDARNRTARQVEWQCGRTDMSFLRPVFCMIAACLLLAASAVGAMATATDEAAISAQSKRLAIVVGNSGYESARLENLPNAANDADRLSASLRRLNFDVMAATDATADALERLLAEAEERLASASAVLIFYAGHGIQISGENYLLPVDTPDPANVEALTERAIKLNDIIARFASRERQTFVFLDACRNNPMGPGAGAGLAQVEVGENAFVAFATQPGNVTVDGSGENSPFTTALLRSIEIPGLSISDMMIRVRNETEALTAGRQVPWDQSNLREQFYFTEQQVIDPVQLSASLSRILSDPAAKEKLQIELASNDLQTAVLIVGEALRSVGSPLTAEPAPRQAEGVQMASLQGARESVVSDLGTLIVGSIAPENDREKERELARNVQTELRRLGCYRMAIDGDWGRGSARALVDYFRNTAQEPTATGPTMDLLGELFLRSGRICKEPVVVRRTAQSDAGANRSTGGGQAATSRNSGGAGRTETAPSRPAAPPPDISGGIGIGGIF